MRWPMVQLALQALSPVLAAQLVKKTLNMGELDPSISDVVCPRPSTILVRVLMTANLRGQSASLPRPVRPTSSGGG